jgi:hypothetical protein
MLCTERKHYFYGGIIKKCNNFLQIVMKVVLFETKSRYESRTFLIILFHLLGDYCQSIGTYFFLNFA